MGLRELACRVDVYGSGLFGDLWCSVAEMAWSEILDWF